MEEPSEDDCCHSDCQNCILDLFQRQLTSTAKKPPTYTNEMMSQIRYKAFRIVKIEESTPSTNIYSFEPISSEEVDFFFNPGEHAVVRNNPESDEEHLSRPYTLIPQDPKCRTFSIVVKLYPKGKMSQVIAEWNVGDITYWRGPYGEFSYRANTFKGVVMICMGTGIAPMYALSKHITDDENDETVIHLLYGSSSPEDIILRRDIALLSSYWNFHCTHFISGGFRDEQKKFNENFIEGRIQKDNVNAIMEGLATADVLGLICGTEDFNKTMSSYLESTGLAKSHIHVFW